MPELPMAPASFEEILDEVEALNRGHLLYYRVQLGRVMLRHFWDGDAAAYSSRDRTKLQRFELFFAKHGEELARYGVSQRQARDSVRACIVVDTLPEHLSRRLFWSQVMELTRVSDPTARARLAFAALRGDWSIAFLRDAVDRALHIGTDDMAALEAAAAASADVAAGEEVSEDGDAPAPAAGRMVARAEKLVREVERWSSTFRKVDAKRLRPAQRARLAAARDALRARVAELDALIGGTP
jgi:hypothetical protein